MKSHRSRLFATLAAAAMVAVPFSSIVAAPAASAAPAAVNVASANSAVAADFSWSWRKEGTTVAFVTLTSNGGDTRIHELIGDCGMFEGDDVRGNMVVNGAITVRLECRTSLNDVRVILAG